MAKTRTQKEQEIQEITKNLKRDSKFLTFGFGGVSVNKLNELRSNFRKGGSLMYIIKRRLFNIALKNKGIKFKPNPFIGQTGLVFFQGDLSDVTGLVYNFINEKESEGKILGGYDISSGEMYEADYLERIGQLPSREVLLGQVVRGISGPIRAFVYTLKAIAERGWLQIETPL